MATNKNPFVRNHQINFNKFGRNVSLAILYQNCSSCHDSSKNMTARGRGLFPLYIYIEKYKKSSCQKNTGRFQYNVTLLVTFYQDLFKPLWFVKNMAARGGAYFSYLYIPKLLKHCLVRNQSTDVNKIWQKYFFGDPLSRLFKPSLFVKKHGHQGGGGGGAYFLCKSI